MSRSVFNFTPEHEAELREFWPSTQPLRILATRWGCSTAYVSIKAKQLGLPSRQLRMWEIRCANYPTTPEQNEYMRREAMLRHMTAEDLQQRLIRTIIRDRLIAAILDDNAEQRAA